MKDFRILAVLLLPLYTAYLSTADYGKIETLVAATAVMVIVLRLGIQSAFMPNAGSRVGCPSICSVAAPVAMASSQPCGNS